MTKTNNFTSQLSLLWTAFKYQMSFLWSPDFTAYVTRIIKSDLADGRVQIRLYEKDGNIFYRSLETLLGEYCETYHKNVEYNSRAVMIGVRHMVLLDFSHRKDLTINMGQDNFGSYLEINKIK